MTYEHCTLTFSTFTTKKVNEFQNFRPWHCQSLLRFCLFTIYGAIENKSNQSLRATTKSIEFNNSSSSITQAHTIQVKPSADFLFAVCDDEEVGSRRRTRVFFTFTADIWRDRNHWLWSKLKFGIERSNICQQFPWENEVEGFQFYWVLSFIFITFAIFANFITLWRDVKSEAIKMENELEKEPLTIYLSGSEGAETRLNLSDVSLNFMRFFIHLSFN